MTTDDMLDALAEIGRPSLMRMEDGGWYAKLKFPAPAGVTAEVASDFSHLTHRDALEQLLERVSGMRSPSSAALIHKGYPDHA